MSLAFFDCESVKSSISLGGRQRLIVNEVPNCKKTYASERLRAMTKSSIARVLLNIAVFHIIENVYR